MIHELLDLFKNLTNEVWINSHGGLYIVMFVLFAETGLFVGFFLPGDSLLFVSGMIISRSNVPFENPVVNLIYWIVLMTVAGVLGNMVGYWFGNKSGHMLFQKKDTFLFKQKHLHQAHDFYERKGGTAIILARFLPIVRTFAPIVAGVVDMNYKKFFSYNVIGCILWVGGVLTIGFMLGGNEWVRTNLDKVIYALILVTTAPVLLKMIFGKKPVAAGGQPNN
ncbi:MAG: VTT domain-containing protein [Flavipsychrobacter sp.]|nr:VTT domain-containing protein [Flavipsychrobacter sp.]